MTVWVYLLIWVSIFSVQKEVVDISDDEDSGPVSAVEEEDDDDDDNNVVLSEKSDPSKSRTKIKMLFKPKSKGSKG